MTVAKPIVSVMRPQRADMVRSIELPGDLVGFYEAALHAKVTGYLKTISVDKGDRVKAGQVLATIEVPELQSNLESSPGQPANSTDHLRAAAQGSAERPAADFAAGRRHGFRQVPRGRGCGRDVCKRWSITPRSSRPSTASSRDDLPILGR